jgi:hypothetical protein
MQLREELRGLYGLVVDLLPQLVVLLLQPLDLLAQSLGVVVIAPLAPLTSPSRRGAAWTRGAVVAVVPRTRSLGIIWVLGMHAAEMLVEILLPRERLSGKALAGGMWTRERLLRTAVFAVDFALVT